MTPIALAFRLALIIPGCLGLSSCNQYWERKETINLRAGDAVAWNAIQQTADPWSAASRDNRIQASGSRAESAMVQYRLGTGAGGGSGMSSGGASAAAK